MQYALFIGVILLISWGVRILIHFDAKKRKREGEQEQCKERDERSC